MPLPKEIEEMIKEEAAERLPVISKVSISEIIKMHNETYISTATKYASEMIGFAEWVQECGFIAGHGDWYNPETEIVDKSELLTLYFKNRGIK